MKKDFFSKELGELIQQARTDKNLSYEDLAEKIKVSADYVEKLERMEIIPNDEDLRRLSGVLGIRYLELRLAAGYNTMGWYPNYYNPDGTSIDIDEILSKIYYKDPSILSRLYEVIFDK